MTNDDYALAALPSAEEPDMTVFLDVFATEDRAPFADLEVFVAGYECVTGEEDSIPATVATLEPASTAGTLPLTCGSPTGNDVTGQAVVEGVTWDGHRHRDRPGHHPGPDDRRGGDRERGELRHVTGICPPLRG